MGISNATHYDSVSILIVDDQDVMLSILHKTLEMLGFVHITRARSGSEALSFIKQTPFDLLLTDYHMPNMSGIELIQQVKPIRPDIRCLVISANATEQHVSDALASGADNYLLKPFTPAVLENKLQRLMKTHEANTPQSPLDLLNETLDALDNLAEDKQTPEQLIGLPEHLKLDTSQCRVLVVDDTPANIQVMLGVLKNKHKTLVANHGQKCLDICHGRVKPDLILLDIMMPEIDGFEVCRQLKADASTQDIPIIFLSALDKPDTIVQALKAGAMDFIKKPIDADILQLRVNNHLKLKLLLSGLKQERQNLIEQLKSASKANLSTDLIPIADALIQAKNHPERIVFLAEQLKAL